MPTPYGSVPQTSRHHGTLSQILVPQTALPQLFWCRKTLCPLNYSDRGTPTQSYTIYFD
jgi:hypothetical protein